MEEEKAAAYYDELTRKGERAARFKQGLGFSSSAPNDDVGKPSSSFLSKFVKASFESKKEAQLQSIHDRLKEKPSFKSRVSCRAFYSAMLFSLFRALVLGYHVFLCPCYSFRS